MLLIKLVLITVFFTIFFQDVKDRMVYWFLYPVAGILGFCIHLYNSSLLIVLTNSGMNLILILFMLGMCYLYSIFVMKKQFINESMGAGDVLLLICLCFTFTTVSFILFLVCSLFFSLIIHKILNGKKENVSVPLAGYMALFFAFIYGGSIFMSKNYLFSY